MKRDERLLLVALAMLTMFLIGELVAAVFAHSLALLADAGHMATDVLALAAAVIAARLARRPAFGHWTFGLARAEVLSAAINGITLVVVAAIVTVEAIRRLIRPVAVHGWTLVVIALIGLAVNLIVAAVLARADRRSINIAGVLAHVLTDAYAFAATIAAGAIVVATGWQRADPIASLLVVVLLLRAASGLIAASGRVLLEAAPSEVDLALVRSHLLESSYVVDLHDLHVWTVTSGLPALSVHVVISDDCFTTGRAPALLDELQACLAGHFDVEHSTFQLEPAGHSDHEAATH
ncbi:MAG TPA: cation diffusion facilitator family transporter [Mycobacteriales bacterium]|jgi:cobalt-zinc-cadmium efflux system protein|nr:cation diffusion facilitator family transporter [Mycobacteriales bacterium]